MTEMPWVTVIITISDFIQPLPIPMKRHGNIQLQNWYFSIDSDNSNGAYGQVVDHTNNDPNGKFLAVYANNPKPLPSVLWQQQVSLEKNADYAFEFWVNFQNLDGYYSDQSSLSFLVSDENGQTIYPTRIRPALDFTYDYVTGYIKSHDDYYLTKSISVGDTVNNGWKKIRYYFHSYNEQLVNLKIEVMSNSLTSFERFAIDDIALLYRLDTDCYENENGSVVCDSVLTNPLCELSLPFNGNFSIPQSDCGSMQTIINNYLQEETTSQYISNLRDSIRHVIIDSCLAVNESPDFSEAEPGELYDVVLLRPGRKSYKNNSSRRTGNCFCGRF